MSSSALFVDRDGVLIKDLGYVCSPQRTHFLLDNIKAIASLERPVVIVTNQAGVARGYYTEDDVHRFHDWLLHELNYLGVSVQGIYYCPHHPDAEQDTYRFRCSCRKPAPGMLRQAASDHGLDLGRSVMVGDQCSDVMAGWNSGIGVAILLRQDNPRVEQRLVDEQIGAPITWIAPDLQKLDLTEIVYRTSNFENCNFPVD